jgi:hypothetical protein
VRHWQEGFLKMRFPTILAASATGLALSMGAALAQSGNFELELNSATDVPEGCRLTYVATNNTGVALDKTSYEVVVFDDTSTVARILVLEFGQLPLNKTRVVQFDLTDMTCSKISRILVNNPVECSSAEGSHDVCLKSLIASSRSQTIQFGL